MGSNWHLRLLDQGQADFIGVLTHFAADTIEPLTQPLTAGCLGYVQCFAEEAILSERLDGIK
jgi:hypothetical protein